MEKAIPKYLIEARKSLKEEDVRFRLTTCLKITLVPLVTFLIMGGLIFIFLKMDLLFFKANDLIKVNGFEETFYDFILHKLMDLMPYLGGLLAFVSLSALYISDFLLRPFREISIYCEKRLLGESASYNGEFLSDLKLLTSFSEFFFSLMETLEKNRESLEFSVPKKYTRIRKPVFETGFFINFSLFMIISMIATSLLVYVFTVDLQEGVINLAQQTLSGSKEVHYFLEKQIVVLETITYVVLGSHILAYGWLMLHLYERVSTPAFGIFATMRAFLNGKYNSRVHLIGFSYLRPYCRTFNKYLDHIERSFVKDKSGDS